MAIIGKIRKRTGLLLLVILGSLSLFVLQEAIPALFDENTNEVGVVAGEAIDRNELEAAKQIQAMLYRGPTGEQLSDQQQALVTSKAWEKMIFKTAYAEQFEKLGIAITREGEGNEAEDLYRGNTISAFFNNFQPYLNQEGKLDKAAMENFLQAMDNPEMLQQDQQGWVYWWQAMKEELAQNRLQEKYTNLFIKSVYVNKHEAKMNYMASNSKASFNYLQISYESMADSIIKYEESQLEEYYQNNLSDYKVTDKRKLSMVVYPLAPSTEDTNRVMEAISSVIEELPTVSKEEDTMYVYKNSNNPVDPAFVKYSALPQVITNDSLSIAEGAIFGPEIKGASVGVYKITDISKDTIYTANVSVIAMAKMSPQGELLTGEALAAKKAEAQAVLDSVLAGEPFEGLANRHSIDPNNMNQQTGEMKGGLIGNITNKSRQYFPEVIDAMFEASQPGVLDMIETQTAMFIVRINEPSKLTSIDDIYRLVTIEKDLFASKKTIRDLKTKANRLIQAANGSADKFVETAKAEPEAPAVEEVILTLEKMLNGDFTITPKVGKSSSLARWAFEEAKVGGTPKFFEIEGNYVVAALTNATNKGENSLEAVKEEVIADYIKQLKYEMFEEIISAITGPLKDRVDEFNKQYSEAKARRERVQDHILSNNYLLGSPEPNVIGAVFGIGEGNRSNPIQGNSGLFIVETIKADGYEEPETYVQEATKKQRSLSFSQERLMNEAIKDWAEIEDKRLKNGGL